MTFKELIPHLKDTPCKEAVEWAGDRNLHECWNTCERGDWMIWLLNNYNSEVTDRVLRLIAVKFARRVQHLMTDDRSIKALDVAERYANGQATDEEVAAVYDVAATDGDAAYAIARRTARFALWNNWQDAFGAGWAAENKAQADIIREFIPQIKIVI